MFFKLLSAHFLIGGGQLVERAIIHAADGTNQNNVFIFHSMVDTFPSVHDSQRKMEEHSGLSQVAWKDRTPKIALITGITGQVCSFGCCLQLVTAQCMVCRVLTYRLTYILGGYRAPGVCRIIAWRVHRAPFSRNMICLYTFYIA